MARSRRENAFERASTRRRMFSASFPTLLDDYVLRDFFLYLGMILSTFLVLVLVFTLFELLGDILAQPGPRDGGGGVSYSTSLLIFCITSRPWLCCSPCWSPSA
jgi:hypothetical protein